MADGLQQKAGEKNKLHGYAGRRRGFPWGHTGYVGHGNIGGNKAGLLGLMIDGYMGVVVSVFVLL